MESSHAGGRSVQTVIVDAGQEGQRIDNFLLARLRGVPRSHVYRLLRTGQVRVNKRRAKPEYRLRPGDAVRLPPVRHREAAAPPPVGVREKDRILKHVLYEDDSLLAVNKPAGLPVHGGTGLPYGLVDLLKAARPHLPFIELAHRIDRHTSGCLLLVKDRGTLQGLHAQFREGEVDKSYLALVKGRWTGRERRVEIPLAPVRHPSGERRIGAVERGKPALTRFMPGRVYNGASLVEARPVTGRTHQIRVHAAQIGHPVAGDAKYGDRTFNREMRRLGLKRLFLHAHRLAFTHPRTGRRLLVHAPLPEDLRRLLRDWNGPETPFCTDCMGRAAQ